MKRLGDDEIVGNRGFDRHYVRFAENNRGNGLLLKTFVHDKRAGGKVAQTRLTS